MLLLSFTVCAVKEVISTGHFNMFPINCTVICNVFLQVLWIKGHFVWTCRWCGRFQSFIHLTFFSKRIIKFAFVQVGYAMTTFHRETEQPVIGFDMGGNKRIKHYHVI